MPLETAEEILAQIPKAKKRFPKAKAVKLQNIVVCGSTKWTDRKKIKQVLSKIDPKTVRFLITGTSRGAEQLCIQVAKELKLAVVVVHPQQHLGASAVFFRDEQVVKFYRPAQLIAFHKNIEESVDTAQYLKAAKRNKVPMITVIDGKAPKKKVHK